jgi:hypothetical protein
VPQLTITTGPELFRFESFADWRENARERFEATSVPSRDTVCIDAKGRTCARGEDFIRAEQEGSWPITVYSQRVIEVIEVVEAEQ